MRIGILATILMAVLALACALRTHEEPVMDALVGVLMLLAPLLAWSVVEPEPAPERTTGLRGPGPLWLRFPFLAGGASGAAFFVLALAVAIAAYVLYLRFVSGHGVWFADDDPVQLVLGALYACVYVLLPTGLLAPVLQGWRGRAAAAVACIGAYPALQWTFPPGAREPWTLTEVGNPWDLISCVLDDGTLIHYARDDVAALAGLAALGIGLHVPRVLRRGRALSRAARGAPVSAAVPGATTA